MSEAYLGEVRPFAFGITPRYWAPCNGQLLPIAQNQPLFSLLGTTYGGDGIRSFALPNLQGRAPVHPGIQGTLNVTEGQVGGTPTATLTAVQIPSHTHTVACYSLTGDVSAVSGNLLANSKLAGTNPVDTRYSTTTDNSTLNAATIATVGGQPHSNMQPSLPINFCICLAGIYPSRG